ncbi:hypothetical protein KY345_04940 [Candidatus Woesearchaeota archaeon]|nr:hypothetical protein [Candidatus Woesearchaeota archaeon]
MTCLIANISSGKGTLAHVSRVIDEIEWEKIFLIATKEARNVFKPNKKVEYVLIDENKHTPEIIEDIYSKLKGKILDTEVALNMISGNGKEHMATLSALLKLGLGVRLIALTKEGVREL